MALVGKHTHAERETNTKQCLLVNACSLTVVGFQTVGLLLNVCLSLLFSSLSFRFSFLVTRLSHKALSQPHSPDCVQALQLFK